MGEGQRERKMESKTTEIQPAVFILSFFYFGLTLNPISLIPPLSIAFFFFLFFYFALSLSFFFFHKSLLLFFHTFKSGLMLRGAELISSVAWASWQGSFLHWKETWGVWNEYRLHVLYGHKHTHTHHTLTKDDILHLAETNLKNSQLINLRWQM